MYSYLFFSQFEVSKRNNNAQNTKYDKDNFKSFHSRQHWHSWCHRGPLHQIKGDLNLFFQSFPCMDLLQIFKVHWYYTLYTLYILCKYEANPCRENFKKIDLNLSFDVGGLSSLLMADIQVNFKLCPIFCSIYLIPTLNLRPGLHSAAFFTYIIKFPAFKLVSFMAYTYNIQGWKDGTRCQSLWQSPLAQLHDSPPQQPHSFTTTLTLSTFNLISINYDNLWLHILNVVEGLIWIGKNSRNNFICHLSWLEKLSPTHTYPLVSICKFSKPYEWGGVGHTWVWWVGVSHTGVG